MSEKVLGFKLSEGYDTCGHGCHWKIIRFTPVVSLEWLEKEIESVKGLELITWKGGSVKDYNEGRHFALNELKERLAAKKVGRNE